MNEAPLNKVNEHNLAEGHHIVFRDCPEVDIYESILFRSRPPWYGVRDDYTEPGWLGWFIMTNC